MATTVNKTVKSSGGDYTSLSAWEAANQGDLVAADEIRQAECFDLSDTTLVSIDGSTTDATRYLRVYAAAGDEAVMPWSASAYRLVVNGMCLTVSDPNTRIERIQTECTNSGGTVRGCIRVTEANCRVIGVLGRNTGTTANLIFEAQNPASSTSYWVNCVAIGNNSNGDGFRMNGGGANAVGRFYNCTAVLSANNFNRVARDAIAKNCLGHGAVTSDFVGTWATGTEYNASEDATAPGTNSRTSQTFTFVNAGGEDYHLASGDAGAKDFGVDLSADASFPFSTDFDNAARSGSWDIGADEITTSTQTVTPSPAAGAWSAASPTVVKGAVTLLPSAVVAAWSIPDPSLAFGGVTVTPSAVAAAFAIADPTILKGTIVLTPNAAAALLSVPAAVLVRGTVTITPSPAVGQWLCQPITLEGGEPGIQVILRRRRRRPTTERRP